MLDLKFIRDNPQVIKDDLKKRNKLEKIPWVDQLIKEYKESLDLKQEVEQLRHKRNIVSQEINKLQKEDKDIQVKVKEVREIPELIKKLEARQEELQASITTKQIGIPNILHKSVPYGKDETENKVIKRWGKVTKPKFELVNHTELLEKLSLADFETARKNSGQGFNYLIGAMAMLDLALQRYGVEFAVKNKFTPVIPPMVLHHDALLGALNGLKDFEEVVYKIENEDLYLIGTAEHSLVTMQHNKVMKERELPLRFCAVTPCFRKEIGGHGVDMKGVFRMHQFNKVEQVVFSTPEKSYKEMEAMQKITEKFFQSLKIPYRVIEICSGDLGAKFAKQWDIEAWFPRQKAYREVTSAGTCTDYQARALNIKYINKHNEKQHVHILNNTMVATSRAMVAILENYQQKDGSIKIPTVLQKYMFGLKKIAAK
ncbi:MAG TPA: serine--tRNA ligase [Candidatus Nanoarchaeia archaeon]|nr:serine--tRNA ligase [Candidatus Nanoarchaeia archaeon]